MVNISNWQFFSLSCSCENWSYLNNSLTVNHKMYKVIKSYVHIHYCYFSVSGVKSTAIFFFFTQYFFRTMGVNFQFADN